MKLANKMELEVNRNFSISAKTCTLKYNSQNGDTILGNNKKYVIPIYQRPYSWTEDQIRKFLSDIFTSYRGNDGDDMEEPMFIGTMQLSDKKNQNEQEIIDGQQRLTTFLILLKVLKIKFSDCKELKSIGLDWLNTNVNKPIQQEYLKQVLDDNLILISDTVNPYLKNAFLINKIIDEQIKDKEDDMDFEIDKFSKYLLSNVYFVVIETRAPLSKTLQIFNSINTAGLDLNGGDLFKIRMYEYLKDYKGMGENAFEEINNLYLKIDKLNSKLEYKETDISGILGIYQYVLVAKYNLPNVLYTYGTDTFFERLFDAIFKIYPWEHFKNNVRDIDLSIRDIEKIIDVFSEWQIKWNNTDDLTAEDACAWHFIKSSRYGRYIELIYVFLYAFKNEDDYWNKMWLFTRQLSKLYTIYSIRFLRAINEVHTFTYSLIDAIINKSFNEVMDILKQKIGKLENHKNDSGYGDFENILTGSITDNAKLKGIICRLSAMLSEDFKTADPDKIEIIRKNLFENDIDIEHIQSYNDSDDAIGIRNEWADNINSLGNLMVLEQAINRSISNNKYEIKIESYPLSKFSIVKQHPINYLTWDLKKCIERKQSETEKILSYIFN
jgi:hypothetical protein